MSTSDPAALAADLLATADHVLDLVRANAPAAEAEVTVRRGTAALTRFANSFIHQNVAEEAGRVTLRVAVNGRVAAASLEGSSEDALARLVDDALQAARARPVDPAWPGVGAAATVDGVDHWDESTATATPDERAARVRAFVDATADLEAAGACETEGFHVAFANTAGQRLSGRATAGEISGIARTGSSDGSASTASVRFADIDGGAAGLRAATKARSAADPTDLDPGRYEVILEPQCVANILRFLFLYGFNGLAVEEGRSFVRLGEAQFDSAITLRDDVADPAQVGVAFDGEGTPKRSIDVVRSGTTAGVLHTRRTAAKAGVESTGHALEGGDAWGAVPLNVVLEGGTHTVDELLGGVRRGLLVTDFWYTRILDPRTEVVTGLTRNGVWLIEGGRIVRPVRNLRFTQSYVEALAPGSVLGVSSERELLLADGIASLVPTLHLASWNFTGGAKG